MTHATFNGGLGYEGKVTLTLKSSDRVIKSQTYKNNGTVELFKFLGNCLASRFNEAAKLLPTKILLLYNTSSDGPLSKNARNVIYRSGFIGYAQPPTIVDDENTESVKVTYNFEVPYHMVENTFNQVALYGASKSTENISKDYTEFSAYHYLTDNNGEFDDQDVSTWSATTILLIEWELTISNKNTVVGNTGEEM